MLPLVFSLEKCSNPLSMSLLSTFPLSQKLCGAFALVGLGSLPMTASVAPSTGSNSVSGNKNNTTKPFFTGEEIKTVTEAWIPIIAKLNPKLGDEEIKSFRDKAKLLLSHPQILPKALAARVATGDSIRPRDFFDNLMVKKLPDEEEFAQLPPAEKQQVLTLMGLNGMSNQWIQDKKRTEREREAFFYAIPAILKKPSAAASFWNPRNVILTPKEAGEPATELQKYISQASACLPSNYPLLENKKQNLQFIRHRFSRTTVTFNGDRFTCFNHSQSSAELCLSFFHISKDSVTILDTDKSRTVLKIPDKFVGKNAEALAQLELTSSPLAKLLKAYIEMAGEKGLINISFDEKSTIAEVMPILQILHNLSDNKIGIQIAKYSKAEEPTLKKVSPLNVKRVPTAPKPFARPIPQVAPRP